jgi:RNA polymerase sigma-70 factor (ECF subfamily)
VSAAESRETPQVRAWIAAACAGDQEAFGALVSANERVVFRTALAALGRREDAEDVAQEAFVMAWRKLRGFRGDSSFRTWLLTITWRKALDRRRARSLLWRRHADTDPDTGPGLEAFAGDVPDPERTALAADLAARTREQIRRLSPKLRDTLLLAASGQHTYPDIAAMLRVPLGTVKWRVAEARRLVAARLGAEEGQP